MKDLNSSVNTDPIAEARRYEMNARETLRVNGKLNTETNRYDDPKYVRSAGHFLWSGVLIALEAAFHVKSEKKKQKGKDSRVDIEDYVIAVNKRDKKLLGLVIDAYNITHLYMGYDGIQDREVCKRGVQSVNAIIDRCEMMLPVAVA